jgi:hypothetical protein
MHYNYYGSDFFIVSDCTLTSSSNIVLDYIVIMLPVIIRRWETEAQLQGHFLRNVAYIDCDILWFIE